MSCFTITVLEPSGKLIQVESIAGTNISTTTLTNYSVPNIELSQCLTQLPSDFNDRIFAVVNGDIVASTGVSISSSGGKLYLNSILDSGTGIALAYNSGIYTISSTGLQPSGNYSLVGHQHIINDISGLQIAIDSKQPSGIYASGIHYHTSSNITDFHTSVSGLLPVSNIIGGTNIAVSNSGSVYTVSVSGQLGLIAEQVDDRVNNLLVAGTGITLDYNDNNDTLTISTSGLQPSGNYSIVGHSHVSSDITNFNTSVSGLLTSYALLNSPSFFGIPTVPTAASGTNTNQIANTAFVRTEISHLVDSAPAVLDTLNELAAALGDDPNFATTIASGLAQKTNIGHSHVSSDITNFNSSVSGLLPVINISAGSGIGISSSSGDFTVSVTGSFGLTSEEVDARVSNLLIGGSYINLDYNDNLNTLTINTSGLQPSGNYSIVGHSHEISDVNGLQITLDSKQPSGVYASGIHYHISSDISDFNIAISGHVSDNLLPHTIIFHSTGSDLLASNINGSNYIYIFNQGAENSSLILPSANNNKSVYNIKNNTNGIIYIKTSNSEQIDGKNPSPIPSGSVLGLNVKYSNITLVSDRSSPVSQWLIL